MKAKFENEKKVNEGYLIVFVTDKNDIEHEITFEKSSEKIVYQGQDGYPDDASKRTNREDEMVMQARRYAKQHVYQNTDYDTLEFHRNPDRIAATLMTIYNMDSKEFERHFGEFYQQARSHADDSVDRPVPIESQRPSGEPVIYKLDLCLDAEIEEMRGLSEEFTDEVDAVAADIFENFSFGGLLSSLGDGLDNITDQLTDATTTDAQEYADDVEFPAFDIDSMSELYYMYHRPNKDIRTVDRGALRDREPDTRIELMAPSVDTLEEFRAFILRHLLCQIRDCYIGCGIEPPGPYRVIGPGIHKFVLKYKHFDMYPEYYDPTATIEGYVS